MSGATSVFAPGIFNDQVFFITGAGRGVAKALALRISALGGNVAVCDLVPERAEETVRLISESSGEAIAIAVDVADERQVQRGIAETMQRWGRIDVLINAAGSYGAAYRATHETPVEEWEGVFASNVRGSFLCAKAVVPHMIAAGEGRIINFASNAGRTVSPLLGCSYTAAKTAVIGLTRHLSREYAAAGIRVNTIAPGPVDGERVSELLGAHGSNGQLHSAIPLGRLADPGDIVEVAIFMASDAARFMTGAIVDVSGGLVLA